MANYDYDVMMRVDSFVYRGVKISVFQTRRGATHCDVDHEPRDRRCVSCNTPISATKVFVSFPANECPPTDPASEGGHGQGPIAEAFSNEACKERTKKRLDETPGLPNPDEIEIELVDEPPPTPPSPPKRPGAHNRRDPDESPLEEKLESLGYRTKINEILARHRKNPGPRKGR